MATTTNYGWTTPDDTALVKDGAAAIRTLGSSVDTTTKALNPSTTLGDIEYRSSTANTNTRLGIGSSGNVLTVAGGVPTWAAPSSGGMTLLSTTSLSGATTTISSISGDYVDLYCIIFGVTNASANGDFRLAPNGNTGIAQEVFYSDAVTVTDWNNDYLWLFKGTASGNKLKYTSNVNALTLTINNYASTTAVKSFNVSGGGVTDNNASGSPRQTWGYINTTSAITSLVFSNAGGDLSTGTVLLYGVK